ncbi:MAG: hypothetical protein QGH77_07255, partial [Planctomycetota bacterium]|nr:hypothetical protein [Planctomycetota bacterium]
ARMQAEIDEGRKYMKEMMTEWQNERNFFTTQLHEVTSQSASGNASRIEEEARAAIGKLEEQVAEVKSENYVNLFAAEQRARAAENQAIDAEVERLESRRQLEQLKRDSESAERKRQQTSTVGIQRTGGNMFGLDPAAEASPAPAATANFVGPLTEQNLNEQERTRGRTLTRDESRDGHSQKAERDHKAREKKNAYSTSSQQSQNSGDGSSISRRWSQVHRDSRKKLFFGYPKSKQPQVWTTSPSAESLKLSMQKLQTAFTKS